MKRNYYLNFLALTGSVASIGTPIAISNFSESKKEDNIELKKVNRQADDSGYQSDGLTLEQRKVLMKNYFKNNTVNIGFNKFGSCVAIAYAMILSYYDTFLNDDLIPEVFDAPVYSASSDNFFSFSPGIYNDKQALSYSNFKTYLDMTKAVESYALQAKFVQIGQYLNFINDKKTDLAMASVWMDSILQTFLEKYSLEQNYSYTFENLKASNGKTIEDAMKEKIDQGYPVYTEITGNGQPLHAVVAYDYDDKGLLYNFGYYESKSFNIHLNQAGYSKVTAAKVLKLSAPYKLSNNYTKISFQEDNSSVETPLKPIDLYNSIEAKNPSITSVLFNKNINGALKQSPVNKFKFKATNPAQPTDNVVFNFDKSLNSAKVFKDGVNKSSSFATSINSGSFKINTGPSNDGVWTFELTNISDQSKTSQYQFCIDNNAPDIQFNNDGLPVVVASNAKDVSQYQYKYSDQTDFSDFDKSYAFVKKGDVSIQLSDDIGNAALKSVSLNDSPFNFEFDDSSQVFLKPNMNSAFTISVDPNSNASISVKKDGNEIVEKGSARVESNGNYDVLLTYNGKSFNYSFTFLNKDLLFDSTIQNNGSAKDVEIVVDSDTVVTAKNDAYQFYAGNQTSGNKTKYNFFEEGNYQLNFVDKFNNTNSINFTINKTLSNSVATSQDTQIQLQNYATKFLPSIKTDDVLVGEIDKTNVEKFVDNLPVDDMKNNISVALHNVLYDLNSLSLTLEYSFTKDSVTYNYDYCLSGLNLYTDKTDYNLLNNFVNEVKIEPIQSQNDSDNYLDLSLLSKTNVNKFFANLPQSNSNVDVNLLEINFKYKQNTDAIDSVTLVYEFKCVDNANDSKKQSFSFNSTNFESESNEINNPVQNASNNSNTSNIQISKYWFNVILICCIAVILVLLISLFILIAYKIKKTKNKK